MLAALADPISRAIVDELIKSERVKPGALAVSIRARLPVGRPTVSAHLTELVEGLVVQRHDDRTVSLINRDAVGLIIQTSRKAAQEALSQHAKDEGADHYLTQRRLNQARYGDLAQLDLDDTSITTDEATPPSATEQLVAMSQGRRAAIARAPTGTRRSAAGGSAEPDEPDPVSVPPPDEAELEELRRITRANFPYPPTPGPVRRR